MLIIWFHMVSKAHSTWCSIRPKPLQQRIKSIARSKNVWLGAPILGLLLNINIMWRFENIMYSGNSSIQRNYFFFFTTLKFNYVTQIQNVPWKCFSKFVYLQRLKDCAMISWANYNISVASYVETTMEETSFRKAFRFH